MNVAITTWHWGVNAGTFLQLYGLYTYIRNRGHHVEVVNYTKRAKGDDLYRGLYYFFCQPVALLKRKVARRRLTKSMIGINQRFSEEHSLRGKRFEEAYRQLVFTEPVFSQEQFEALNNRFDAFVVGSDQVWNPTMLNRRYLLDYVAPGKVKASYAPSMGTAQVLPFQRKVYKKYLEDFNYISTREKRLAEILNEELPQDVKHVLDPSMLISREEYLRMAHLPEEFDPDSYVLCYFIPRNEKQKEQVRQFAKANGKKIVVMNMITPDYDFEGATLYPSAGPREFLGLISNAAAVFTSSFHCTIFSILFHRDLYVYQQPPSTSKSADINQRFLEQLQTYGITHRFVPWLSDITTENLRPIDYGKVDEIFRARMSESIAFLNQFV